MRTALLITAALLSSCGYNQPTALLSSKEVEIVENIAHTVADNTRPQFGLLEGNYHIISVDKFYVSFHDADKNGIWTPGDSLSVNPTGEDKVKISYGEFGMRPQENSQVVEYGSNYLARIEVSLPNAVTLAKATNLANRQRTDLLNKTLYYLQ